MGIIIIMRTRNSEHKSYNCVWQICYINLMWVRIIFITIRQKCIFLYGNCETEQSRAVLLGRELEKVISTDDISCKGGKLSHSSAVWVKV